MDKYILSLSYGKDSVSLLLYIIKHKLPLDAVIHCQIKYSDKISGEHPLMAEWIPTAEIQINKLLNDNGYNCKIENLTAKKNFTQQFYTIKEKGNHIGDRYGFPYVIGAWCNGRLKLDPIANYIKSQIKNGNNVIEYIGIAQDEPKRLKRYKKLTTNKHKYTTLADFNITENEAMQMCRENNLLSPKYNNSFRGGVLVLPKAINV